MASDGRAVANYVLDYCETKGKRVTNLALQKLLFFCHVWSLIELKRPLVKHQFEAWNHGPVLQYLYQQFRCFKDKPILSRAMGMEPNTGEFKIVRYDLDNDTRALLERVLSFYLELTPGQLVKLTHVRGGPWDTVWNHARPVNPGMKIDNSIIIQFYSRMRAPFSVQ